MNKFLKVVHYLNWVWVMLAVVFTYIGTLSASTVRMPDMVYSLLLIIMHYCFARAFDELFKSKLDPKGEQG